MPVTYKLIASSELTSNASSVTFSSIPTSYTDLVIRGVARSSDGSSISDVMTTELNGNTSALYSNTLIFGNNTSTGSIRSSSDAASRTVYYTTAGTATSDSFGIFEIYIPGYQANRDKPYGSFGVAPTVAANPRIGANASLFRSTTAVSSIKLMLLTGPNFVSGSSFYLFGISNT